MLRKAHYGSLLHSASKAIKVGVEMGKGNRTLWERWLSSCCPGKPGELSCFPPKQRTVRAGRPGTSLLRS